MTRLIGKIQTELLRWLAETWWPHGPTVCMLALLARATERGMRVTIPATALAQAIRNPTEQARLCRLIRQAGTDLIALDGPEAAAVGLLLARAGSADITDSHVVVCARRAGQAVVTSDAGGLRRIAPGL